MVAACPHPPFRLPVMVVEGGEIGEYVTVKNRRRSTSKYPPSAFRGEMVHTIWRPSLHHEVSVFTHHYCSRLTAWVRDPIRFLRDVGVLRYIIA